MSSSSDRSNRETPRHSIGVVSRRTGLKPDLVRAWERRYGAVEPARSETRRRRYSDAQVRRLSLLAQAVDGGRNIGDVAGLPDEELEELIAGDAAATATAGGGRAAAGAAWGEGVEETAAAIRDACLAAVGELDGRGLERELDRASVALSRSHLLERVLEPLMEAIGDLWQEGALRPLHEHMASAVVRSFLGGLRGVQPDDGGAPCIVLTTPVGQRHELGALMAASTAVAEGWRALYLGPDLPAEEIAACATACDARAVGLSLVYPPDDPALPGELARLRRLAPEGAAVLAGGRAAPGYREPLEDAGVRVLDALPALRRALGELREGALQAPG